MTSDFDSLTSPSIETWKTMANAEKNDIIIKFDVFLAKLQSLIFNFLFASSSKSRLLIFGLKSYLYKPNNWFCTDIFLSLGYPRVAGRDFTLIMKGSHTNNQVLGCNCNKLGSKVLKNAFFLSTVNLSDQSAWAMCR